MPGHDTVTGHEAVIVAGSGHPALAAQLADELGMEHAAVQAERFPDGELRLRIESSIAGRDVFVVEPAGPPVNDHLVELLLLIDAARRAGAHHISAVVPYMGYARQDRREPGEPLSLRVVGDLLSVGGLDRVIVMDPHTPALEAALGVATVYTTAVPALCDAIAEGLSGEDAVVVAPDLGAVKLAEEYARRLDLPVALVRKYRISGLDVTAEQVTGGVARRIPIIIDDMISTGGTVAAATRMLLDLDAVPRVVVAATHGIFAGPAVSRLSALPIERLIVTDTLPPQPDLGLPARVVPVAPLLAAAIRPLLGEHGGPEGPPAGR